MFRKVCSFRLRLIEEINILVYWHVTLFLLSDS